MEYKYKDGTDMKVGDRIRDIEDGDFYFEGIVTEITPDTFYYILDKVIFGLDDNEEPDEDKECEELGQTIEQRWSWITKLNTN